MEEEEQEKEGEAEGQRSPEAPRSRCPRKPQQEEEQEEEEAKEEEEEQEEEAKREEEEHEAATSSRRQEAALQPRWAKQRPAAAARCAGPLFCSSTPPSSPSDGFTLPSTHTPWTWTRVSRGAGVSKMAQDGSIFAHAFFPWASFLEWVVGRVVTTRSVKNVTALGSGAHHRALRVLCLCSAVPSFATLWHSSYPRTSGT